MGAEQEPIEACEAGLVVQVADRFDFLSIPPTGRPIEGDVLEDPFRPGDLKMNGVYQFIT